MLNNKQNLMNTFNFLAGMLDILEETVNLTETYNVYTVRGFQMND